MKTETKFAIGAIASVVALCAGITVMAASSNTDSRIWYVANDDGNCPKISPFEMSQSIRHAKDLGNKVEDVSDKIIKIASKNPEFDLTTSDIKILDVGNTKLGLHGLVTFASTYQKCLAAVHVGLGKTYFYKDKE
jgi:hypothetical protein